MYALPPEAIRLVHDEMFPAGLPEGGRGVLEWGAPGAERHLVRYKRRPYATERVPVLDRSRYVIEYHWGEGSCCGLHPVIHDTSCSFLLSYDDIALGLVGFDRVREEKGSALVVKQIQGAQYRTGHSGRDTGAEAPAKSVSWQPALLHMVTALAHLERTDEVVVHSHVKSLYRKVRNDWFGNARRLYDGTARDCGFEYDETRESWVRKTAPVAADSPAIHAAAAD